MGITLYKLLWLSKVEIYLPDKCRHYIINVGFSMFFICKTPRFLLLMLSNDSCFSPGSSVSFWIFFLVFCYLILNVYLPPSSYLFITMFYYYSTKVFTCCSYKHCFCSMRAVFGLWVLPCFL